MTPALRFASLIAAAPYARASWTSVAIRTRRSAQHFLMPFSGTG
jgi:hypothetical protein